MIVLNHDGGRFLEPCLKALEAQVLDGGFEVLLVDNASSDGSPDLVRSRFPSVRVIEAGANLGFAAGNNLGISKATAQYIVLLNNDTQVRPGWLTALVEAAVDEPRVGAVTAKLLFRDQPGTIQNAGCLLLTDGSGADRGSGEPDDGRYDTREEVFGACGASVLYRREMLDDVGLLDPTFFMYYEDTDLNWRMRLRGWRVVYEPGAVVDHVHAGSSGEWSPLFTFHVDRNRLFMILKNAPLGFVVRAFGGFARASALNAIRTVWGRLRRPPAALARADLGSGRARIHLRVLLSLIRHTPEMLVKRSRIRSRRAVPDSAIEGFLFPRELWDARFR